MEEGYTQLGTVLTDQRPEDSEGDGVIVVGRFKGDPYDGVQLSYDAGRRNLYLTPEGRCGWHCCSRRRAKGISTSVRDPHQALGEALDERERGVGDFAPAAVDDQRVSMAGDLLDLGHAGVVLLLLVGGVDDRPRDGVVQLAGDEQQWPAVRVLGVDLGLGPGIQVGRS